MQLNKNKEMDKMENLITGQKLAITGNEKDFHGFEDGTIVEFLTESNAPVFGYMVRGEDAEGTEITVKVLDEHIKQA